jgi:hypothetical protein
MKENGLGKREAGAGNNDHRDKAGCNRRTFVKRALLAGAAANAAGLSLGARADDAIAEVSLGSSDSAISYGTASNPMLRRAQAYQIRLQAAQAEMQQPVQSHPTNGDEDHYGNKIGNFSKGLPHNGLGEVDLGAYATYLRALTTGSPADFERITLGCATGGYRLVDPQAGLAYDLEGADSHALAQPPAPAFGTAEETGEIIENYWMALARDVPFSAYGTSTVTQAAADDLSRLSDFRGPKTNGGVTPDTLFRGALRRCAPASAGCGGVIPGVLSGPYISQFLWLPAPFGSLYVEQQMLSPAPGQDFLTAYSDWLNVQNGCLPAAALQYDSARRYIRNGRDLGQWVHIDVLHEAYFNAMLMLGQPASGDPYRSGLGAPLNPGNPYNGATRSATQDGFGTFGFPHIAALLPEVASRALHAVWFQKWFVHRRLRPEAYAGAIHNYLTRGTPYPVGTPDLAGSQVLNAVFGQYGTYLLPMAFPEGCPLHPAYGAGHATVAGACVTILKAWFDETYVIPNPVEAAPDGLALQPYTGPDHDRLTVGGELNKLAANIALGRNIAGVHWRSDASESLLLGEAVALSILQDQRNTYNENFGGFTFTKFDGTRVTV